MKSYPIASALSASLLALATPACAQAQHHHAEAAPLMILKPADANFQVIPNAATCNKMASLRGDLSKEASTFTSKMTPGCVAPWHWHSSTEELVIQQGTARMQMDDPSKPPVDLATGAYAQLPSNHLHRFKCLEGPDCILVVITDRAFDIHWVDKNRKEITFDEALKLEKVSAAW